MRWSALIVSRTRKAHSIVAVGVGLGLAVGVAVAVALGLATVGAGDAAAFGAHAARRSAT
jgi:hypothetical protein